MDRHFSLSIARVFAHVASTLAVCLASCSERTLTSRSVDDVHTAVGPVAGLSYHLPRGIVPITIGPGANGSVITITQGGTQMIPDRHAKYLAEWHESGFSDDTFSVTVDKNGLLASINSDVTDRTPDIAKKIIEIATDAVLAAASQQPPDASTKITNCQASLLVDPFSQPSISHANRALSGCKLRLAVTFPDGGKFPSFKSAADEQAFLRDGDLENRDCSGSICFRPVVPVTIRISGPVVNTAVDATLLAIVPDVRTVASYDLRRGACIERNSTLTFDGGVLTKADLKKPSEVLACLEIPLAIAKAFATVPGQLLTFKVNQTTSEASLLQQQRNVIVAQQALVQAQAAAK